MPYHESDHVLNLAYNLLAGGVRLEDIELRRQDENFLNGLDAQRIPDPTTAGDCTRRFDAAAILHLQECFNRARLAVWKVQPKGFLAEAFLDVDGTIAGTLGECKEGIGLAYKGIWGYAPLIVSLANAQGIQICPQERATITDGHPRIRTDGHTREKVRGRSCARRPVYAVRADENCAEIAGEDELVARGRDPCKEFVVNAGVFVQMRPNVSKVVFVMTMFVPT